MTAPRRIPPRPPLPARPARPEGALVRPEGALVPREGAPVPREGAPVPREGAPEDLGRTGDTVVLPPAAAAWAPAPAPVGRRSPRTLPVDVISTVPGVPREVDDRRAEDAAVPPASVLAMLRWDDGTRHTVYEATLFGRAPAGEPGRRTAPVRDETLSISRTHFEIGADEHGAWIVDRHSLNGLIVTRDGRPRRLEPERPTRIWSGDVLDLGDRRVTVESAR